MGNGGALWRWCRGGSDGKSIVKDRIRKETKEQLRKLFAFGVYRGALRRHEDRIGLRLESDFRFPAGDLLPGRGSLTGYLPQEFRESVFVRVRKLSGGI